MVYNIQFFDYFFFYIIQFILKNFKHEHFQKNKFHEMTTIYAIVLKHFLVGKVNFFKLSPNQNMNIESNNGSIFLYEYYEKNK